MHWKTSKLGICWVSAMRSYACTKDGGFARARVARFPCVSRVVYCPVAG